MEPGAMYRMLPGCGSALKMERGNKGESRKVDRGREYEVMEILNLNSIAGLSTVRVTTILASIVGCVLTQVPYLKQPSIKTSWPCTASKSSTNFAELMGTNTSLVAATEDDSNNQAGATHPMTVPKVA